MDWKALSHAVRIGQEAIKLLTIGRLVFPLACAGHLVAIKQDHVPYEAVTEEIARLFHAVKAAENLVLQAYRRQVLAG